MTALSITLRKGVCPRAQTRPTRLLRPDGLTRPKYQLTRPTWLTRIWMTSAWHNCDVSMHSRHVRDDISWCKCDVSMHSRHVMSSATSSTSQQTRQHSGTHLPRHQPRAELRRAELSRAVVEPRDRIQCSWSYVQPDLRLNLGRSSGQNCFDQILAVWNAIWTISDLFPANLIVPDAMVWSDRWDLRPKSGGGELTKRDCPIRRHLKGIMVVDEDEEEEGAHVYPITYAELLSG